MAHFLQETKVKELVHERGKRVSKEYLAALDSLVNDLVEGSCKVFNGGSSQLTPLVLNHALKGIAKQR